MNGNQIIMNWMKWGVVSVKPDTTLQEAAEIVVQKRVGTLPIVDDEGVLIGITTLREIIHIFLPDFVDLLADIGFVKDYGNLGEPSKEALEQAESMTVSDIMQEAVSVEDDSSLIRALSVMESHDIQDLCVIREGVLVGIASRVDIGRAFLADWGSMSSASEESD